MAQIGQLKADRYISLLNTARCDSNWQDVPELVRKLKKHAPHKKCLIQTASSEYEVVAFSQNRSVDLPQHLPLLQSAIDSAANDADDVLQARVCQGWIHWTLGEPTSVLSHLRREMLLEYVSRAQKGRLLSEWTRVCVIKGLFIIGDSLERTTGASAALSTYFLAMPLILQSRYHSASPELRTWCERVLGTFCIYASKAALQTLDEPQINTALTGFRVWARFWEGQPGHGPVVQGGFSPGSGTPRRQLWLTYYTLLSILLQKDPTSRPCSAVDYGTSHWCFETSGQENFGFKTGHRLQQRAELQRVQDIYERLMLIEVPFPDASSYNPECEEWVEKVISNWRVFCGSSWRNDDLGEGGKDAVGRTVLEVLYRAAAKTFQSTSILRHLFIVHLSLAEFDLAFRALDTYLEIVKKVKARVQKSGKAEPALDPDDVIIETGAEKARGLESFIQQWLHEIDLRATTEEQQSAGNSSLGHRSTTSADILSSGVKAFAYRALAISQAEWSRVTFDAASRPAIREQAISNLRRAASAELGSNDSPKSLFALGLLLAEARETEKALVVVKQALLTQDHLANTTPPRSSEAPDAMVLAGPGSWPLGNVKNVPLWHLLILLLSAKQDFIGALTLCEAVLEASIEGTYSYNTASQESVLQTEGFNDSTGKEQRHSIPFETQDSLIHALEVHEKAALIQLKMTHLALLEVMEDQEAAVNASGDLLNLYSELFGRPLLQAPKIVTNSTVVNRPPKSSSGTVKSIGGSLLGKAKGRRSSLPWRKGSDTVDNTSKSETRMTDPAQNKAAWEAPIIEVTDESKGTGRVQSRKGSSHHTIHRKGLVQNRKLRRRSHSNQRSDASTAYSLNARTTSVKSYEQADRLVLAAGPTTPNDMAQTGSISDVPQPAIVSKSGYSDIRDAPVKGRDPLPGDEEQLARSSAVDIPAFPHNLSSVNQTLDTVPSGESPKQDVRLPSASPCTLSDHFSTNLPKAHEARYKMTVLVKIWLLIAGLYRRAALYEDAKGAVDEAHEVLDAHVAESARETPVMTPTDMQRGFDESVNELWGDVYAERGYLARAQNFHHEALARFEQALSHCVDHPVATVGLCTLLLDIAAQIIPPFPSSSKLAEESSIVQELGGRLSTDDTGLTGDNSSRSVSDFILLNRLAARDRAYSLLSSLTKLGSGWDFSDAWFALARAYEESGEKDKAVDILWWCVELEDRRPIRHWRNVGPRGYIL